MAGKENNRMQCSEFDALLSQAIDGTLAGEKLAAFEAHGRECQLCGPLLQEAEAGRSWLKAFGEVEPPEDLVMNVLLRTTGVSTVRLHGGPSRASRMDRIAECAAPITAPLSNHARNSPAP